MSKTEQLLQPRYKVIAQYPYSPYPTGDILVLPKNQCEFYNNYPHLFKKLEWWQERELSDMPEYVKTKDINLSRQFEYFHAQEWIRAYSGNKPHFATLNMFNEKYYLCADQFLPIAEQEYLTYQSKQK